MGKHNMYEHTIRVPLIIAGPGVPKGKRSEALCYLRDLYPTICDLTGTAIPKSVEGKSLKPVINGKQDAIYSEIYGYFRDKQRMVRNNRYKLIHYPLLDRHQLFDLKNDPHELNDLIDDKRHGLMLGQLREKLASKNKEWKALAGGNE